MRHAWAPRSVEVGGELCVRCDLKRRTVQTRSVRERDRGRFVSSVEVFNTRTAKWDKVTGRLPPCKRAAP